MFIKYFKFNGQICGKNNEKNADGQEDNKDNNFKKNCTKADQMFINVPT